ncbi:MAG: acetyl-CoA acetyltransferase [Bacteroidetes bacterium]|nr:acetyl-CoA acetyltransferase [Bacteroidota bacterium]
MKDKIAIIGIGCTQARPTSGDVSYREMIYEAAVKAYNYAGISPRDVGTFISTAEDMTEGVSIFDEYVPDQLGAVLKPVHTISGDCLQGIASAYLQIATGAFRVAVVETHSKASNILFPAHIEEFAMDPHYSRYLHLDPVILAGMEMRKLCEDTGANERDVARVITEARRNAMENDLAAYPGNFSINDILATGYVAEPLRSSMVQGTSDGACIFILASEDVTRATCKKPVYIDGISFFTGEPSMDTWKFGKSKFTELASAKAYKMAGIKCPYRELSFAEIDDSYGYKFFIHAEALHLCESGESVDFFRNGAFSPAGELPVNISGGVPGFGKMHGAACGYQLIESVRQLRGEAGKRQLKDTSRGLVQSWRGLPTQTGAVAILSN